jgi:hypothetical protein
LWQSPLPDDWDVPEIPVGLPKATSPKGDTPTLPANTAKNATEKVLVRTDQPDKGCVGNANVPSASPSEDLVAAQLARINSILDQHTTGLSSLQEIIVDMASEMDKTMNGMYHELSEFSVGVSEAMEYFDTMLTKSARAISMLKSSVG